MKPTGRIVAETERLVLCEFTLADAAFFRALVNDPDWLANIGDRNVHSDVAARDYLAMKYLTAYRMHGFGLWLVARREDGEPVGMCGLVRRDGLDDVDIGFAFLPAGRGRGFAVEAARAVLHYARETAHLPRVVAIVLPANRPSIAVLEKIGMRFEQTVQLPDDTETLALYVVDFAAAERHRAPG